MAEHPPGRAWEDWRQWICPVPAESKGGSLGAPPSSLPAAAACPHQQTWLLRHGLASSQMEKSLYSRLSSASLAEQGCLGVL